MQPKCTVLLDYSQKNKVRCIGRDKNKNTRVGCGCSVLWQNLTRKSSTKPTQTKVEKTYDSALYFTQTHPYVAYMQFGKDFGTSSVELLTQLNHVYQCFKVHATTKLHVDWHLNWFKLTPAQHNKFDRISPLIFNANFHASTHIQYYDFFMHMGYEETSQSKILKSQICVQKRGVCIILHKGQLKGPSQYVQLKILNLFW